MSNTVTGTVKWFNETKGFGFIQRKKTGPDVFALLCNHRRRFPKLLLSQKVEFINQGQKGPTS
ncbi:cold shock domain-containing protein [Vibrio lentus]|nr:cold shock domain-containing protein [Vibrio lentus]